MSKFESVTKSAMTLREANACPIEGIPERGISKSTAERFGVRTEFDKDRDPAAHLFPVTKKGEITGYIRRALGVPKKQAWSTIGDVSSDSDLLGRAQSKGGKRVWITEGGYDMLSAYQSLKACAMKRGYRGEPQVTSLALGCGMHGANAKQQVAHNAEWLETFAEVHIVFDDDEAGHEAVHEVALVLPEIKNIKLEGSNDVNDLLLAEGEQRVNQMLMFGGKEYEPGSLIYTGLPMDRLLAPLKPGVFIDACPQFMAMLNGFREREMTIVLAPPKAGKTTICKLFQYELARLGQCTYGCYLEEDIVKTQQSMLALHAGVHLPSFRMNPKIADSKMLEEGKALLDSGNLMFFDDRVGGLRAGSVVANFEWAAIRGAKYIFLDHLSFVFSGEKDGNERKGIDNLLTELASFVKRTGVHVIVVAHIRRDSARTPPKNADGSIQFPYWLDVKETDGRGSGAFEQVAWNLVGIDKEITESGARGRIRLSVLLNREWDKTGKSDIMTMSPQGKLITTSEEY